MTENLHPHEDPKRRCLKVHEWPEADRLAWELAFEPGDVLDDTVGPGVHWSEQTREKYRKGYGRWLTFLILNGGIDPDQHFAVAWRRHLRLADFNLARAVEPYCRVGVTHRHGQTKTDWGLTLSTVERADNLFRMGLPRAFCLSHAYRPP